MKSRDTLIRLKRFQVEERRRRVMQIDMMSAEFSRMASELDREIALEEKRSGITDQAHFAYPTYAKAAITRRDNLKRSKGELETQLAEARARLDEAQEDCRKAEALDGRERGSERLTERSDMDLTSGAMMAVRA